jgi:hypothetical protein
MPSKIIAFLLFSAACSQMTPVKNPEVSKEFAQPELIMASQLLTKIFDGEMAPLSCVPDSDEASLLLRTIQPRMEVVQDDLESMLDDPSKVDELIKNCDKSCTCPYVDDLLKEHVVALNKEQKKIFEVKKSQKEINRCLAFMQETFCKGELYEAINKEKEDFSFEE